MTSSQINALIGAAGSPRRALLGSTVASRGNCLSTASKVIYRIKMDNTISPHVILPADTTILSDADYFNTTQYDKSISGYFLNLEKLDDHGLIGFYKVIDSETIELLKRKNKFGFDDPIYMGWHPIDFIQGMDVKSSALDASAVAP